MSYYRILTTLANEPSEVAGTPLGLWLLIGIGFYLSWDFNHKQFNTFVILPLTMIITILVKANLMTGLVVGLGLFLFMEAVKRTTKYAVEYRNL